MRHLLRDFPAGPNRQEQGGGSRIKQKNYTRELLEHLFKIHGAPLVLKGDGGKDLLVSAEVKKLLEEYGVTGLLSPPYYPRY
ncbi:MAG: hypothetical protein HY897_16345, partial [Deltaproteobacteria bacterium]|nr:hypothetical protein [Deltaproteobacteria bacterium]